MPEILNFNGFLFVLNANWMWILVAFALGIWFGWSTAAPETPAEDK